jgi:hypothetical protein
MRLAGHALLQLPAPGFTTRQQGKHAKDAAAVADADVKAGNPIYERELNKPDLHHHG